MAAKTPKEISKIIKDLIDNRNVDENYNELIELKALLSSASAQQLEEVVKEVNVSQFCHDLNAIDDDRQDIDLLVSVFDSVFGTLSPQFILSHFHKEIVTGFDAKNETIVDLWLKTCDRCLKEELALNHTINPDLDVGLVLTKVIGLMYRQRTSTAKYCQSIVLNIAKSQTLCEKFFEKGVQELMVKTKLANDIIRMRIYELLVSIANTSHKTFYRVESFGHLKDLLEDFNKDSTTDPLLTLNILEIMTDLGSTSFGTEYLQTSDILKTIAQRLNDSGSDIFGNLLIPGYIKIFGNLAANEPKILDNFPIVLSKLKSLLDDLDITLRLSAVDAIAVVCNKNAGKTIVNKDPDMSKRFMAAVSHMTRNGNTDHKMRALNAVSNVIKLNETDANDLGTNFSEKWFQLFLGSDRVTTLLRLSKEPFLELRLSAIECVRVLATFLWGQKELASTPGFLQYIMDRSTETSKEGKEAKFSVVKELIRSPVISESFAKEAVIQLRAYYKEGAYYIGNETAVSFEAQ